MPDILTTTRETAAMFDVSTRTLRFYESKELLAPIREGQKRFFTPRDRARMKLILRGKRFGFSLEELRQLLNLYDTEGGKQLQLRKALKVGERHLALMQAHRTRLDQVIAELKGDLRAVEGMLVAEKETVDA